MLHSTRSAGRGRWQARRQGRPIDGILLRRSRHSGHRRSRRPSCCATAAPIHGAGQTLAQGQRTAFDGNGLGQIAELLPRIGQRREGPGFICDSFQPGGRRRGSFRPPPWPRRGLPSRASGAVAAGARLGQHYTRCGRGCAPIAPSPQASRGKAASAREHGWRQRGCRDCRRACEPVVSDRTGPEGRACLAAANPTRRATSPTFRFDGREHLLRAALSLHRLARPQARRTTMSMRGFASTNLYLHAP